MIRAGVVGLCLVLLSVGCGEDRDEPGADTGSDRQGEVGAIPDTDDAEPDAEDTLDVGLDTADAADAADAPDLELGDADDADASPDADADAPDAAPAHRTDLLVVFANGNEASEALARYYADPETGRNIDPSLILGLDVPDTHTIDRDTYESAIRAPLADWIWASGKRYEIKYILLIKGIPHRIRGAAEFDPAASTFSSVDSELCTLFSPAAPVEGWLFNGPRYNDYVGGGGYYLSDDAEFRHQRFTVTSRSRTFNLDYLVGRIDGYSYETAQALIDRAREADAAGGWVILDSSPSRMSLDTMVDPVWPQSDDSGDSAEERLTAAGINVVADRSATRLTGRPEDGLPEGALDVVAYAGWGVNHGGPAYEHGAEYIREDLQFVWRPGAAWLSYESFNGTVLDGQWLADNPGARRGQGQVGDFLEAGGTVAIGNAWEPFASAVGHEAHIFERYLVHGDPWIEAAYKGLRYLSWQEVVLGDPLCRVTTP